MPQNYDKENSVKRLDKKLKSGQESISDDSDSSSESSLEQSNSVNGPLTQLIQSFTQLSLSCDNILPPHGSASKADFAEADSSAQSACAGYACDDYKDGYEYGMSPGKITLKYLSEIGYYSGYTPLPNLLDDNDVPASDIKTGLKSGIQWVINGHGAFTNHTFILPKMTLLTPEDLSHPYITEIDREYHLEKDFQRGYVKALKGGGWTFYHQQDVVFDVEITPWKGHQELPNFIKAFLRDPNLWSNIDKQIDLYYKRDPDVLLVVKTGKDRYQFKKCTQAKNYFELITKTGHVPIGEIPLLFLSPKIGKIKVLNHTLLSEVSYILTQVDESARLLCATCNALPHVLMNKVVSLDHESAPMFVDALSDLNDSRLLSYECMSNHFFHNQANKAYMAVSRYNVELNRNIEHGPLPKNQACYDFERIISGLLLDVRGNKVHFRFGNHDCRVVSPDFEISLSDVLCDMNWQFIDVKRLSQLYEDFLFIRSKCKPKTRTHEHVQAKVDFGIPPDMHTNLSFAEMAAINLYTLEAHQTGWGKSLYEPLNKLLWSQGSGLNDYINKEDVLKELLIHSAFLASGINHADKTRCSFVYRAERKLPNHVLRERICSSEQERPLCEGGFISASYSSHCAIKATQNQLGEHHTIFHNVVGIDVGKLSFYDEQEFLMPPVTIKYDRLNNKSRNTISIAHPILSPTARSPIQLRTGLGHYDELCEKAFHDLMQTLFKEVGNEKQSMLLQFMKAHESQLNRCMGAYATNMNDYEKTQLLNDILMYIIHDLNGKPSTSPWINLKIKLLDFIDSNPLFAALDDEYFESEIQQVESIEALYLVVRERFDKAINSTYAVRWIYDEQGFAYTNDEIQEILMALQLKSLDEIKALDNYERIPDLILASLERLFSLHASKEESRVLSRKMP